jgi:hypothetical protein
MIINYFTQISNIICVIIGFFLSLIGQVILQRINNTKKTRKYLVLNITRITKYILEVKNAIISLLNFMQQDLNNFGEDECNEIIESIHYHTKEVFLLWPEFRTIIYLYLTIIIKNRRFKEFEKIMNYISYDFIGTKLDKFIKPDKEMILARQESLRRNHKEYLFANDFISFIEEEYIKKLRKI